MAQGKQQFLADKERATERNPMDYVHGDRADAGELDRLATAIHRLADVQERSMATSLGGALMAGHNPAPPPAYDRGKQNRL